MEGHYFEACGRVVVPKVQWLDDLLKAYFDGDIDGHTLMSVWINRAVEAGYSESVIQSLMDFSKACVGIAMGGA